MSATAVRPAARTALPATPYKGLVPYSEEDALFFFGREQESDIIAENLIASRLTLVYGPSGVGKSSLLRAGVVRHLRDLARENLVERGTPEFVVALFSSWRDDPLAGLSDCIRSAVAEQLPELDVEPPPALRSLTELLQLWTERLDARLLIVFDQFEEYFLYHDHEHGPGTFAGEFPRAVGSRELQANFLVAIRDDAWAKLDRFKGQLPQLFGNFLRIDHLGPAAARAAIEKPVERYNRLLAADGEPVAIEPALVEKVLQQVRAGRVALAQGGRGVVEGRAGEEAAARIETPYLQLVMTRLWNEEMLDGSRVLRLQTLARLGSAERIVRTHLDEAMRALPPGERDIAADIFHHLVTPSGAKIAHTAPDLAKYARLDEADLTPVLETLAGGGIRVLRPVAPPPGTLDGSRYEIFHDGLGAAVLDWRARHVRERERAEAEAKLEAQERERAAAEARARRERAAARRFRAVAVASAALALAVVAVAVWAIGQKGAAQAERRHAVGLATIAKSRELAAQAMSKLPVDPKSSESLAVRAVRLAPKEPQGREALRQALLDSHVTAVLGGGRKGHRAWVDTASFSPDGKHVVTASDDHTARIWDAATGTQLAVLRGHKNWVRFASFSPVGGRIVTASWDKTARIWDARTGKELRKLLLPFAATRAAFSPDGARVVTIGTGSRAFVWDVRTGRRLAVLRGHGDWVSSASFSPDGKRIVTSSWDRTARVWNARTGAQLSVLRGHRKGVRRAAYSPDGKLIVTAGYDRTARVWDAATGTQLATLRGDTDYVTTAVFSKDGRRVATASADGTARVWTVTGRLVAVMRGHRGRVNTVAFSPDGRWLVTAGEDQTARVWDATRTAPPRMTLLGHTDWVDSAVFSPDGTRIVTASDDGTARVWDATAGRPGLTLRGHKGEVAHVAFSSDGRLVLTTGVDATARVFEAATGRHVATLGKPYPLSPWLRRWIAKKLATFNVPPRNIAAMVLGLHAAFSPDGSSVVTGGWDGVAGVWQARGGSPAAVLRRSSAGIEDVAFSRDGTLIAGAGDDRTARVWDARTGRELHVLRGHTGDVLVVAFSPDGSRIVTAGRDFTARLWDTETGRALHVLRGHTGTVRTAVFSPDGRRVVTGSDDDDARVWDVRSGKLLRILRRHGNVRAVAFSPDGKWVATAGEENTARIWNVRSGKRVADLRGHTDWLNDIAFSPDGRLVVTASDDGTARIWEARSGHSWAELRGHTGPVLSAAFSPRDPDLVVTGSADGTAQIYTCRVCGSPDDLLRLAASGNAGERPTGSRPVALGARKSSP